MECHSWRGYACSTPRLLGPNRLLHRHVYHKARCASSDQVHLQQQVARLHVLVMLDLHCLLQLRLYRKLVHLDLPLQSHKEEVGSIHPRNVPPYSCWTESPERHHQPSDRRCSFIPSNLRRLTPTHEHQEEVCRFCHLWSCASVSPFHHG